MSVYRPENSRDSEEEVTSLMTRETKVGLLMVVLLVGVFGFMVYKKLLRSPESLAATTSQDADNGHSVFEHHDDPLHQKTIALQAGTVPPRNIQFDEFATPAKKSRNTRLEARLADESQPQKGLSEEAQDIEDIPEMSPRDSFGPNSQKLEARPSPEITDSDPFAIDENIAATAVTNSNAEVVSESKPTSSREDPFETPPRVSPSKTTAVGSTLPDAFVSSQTDDPFSPRSTQVTSFSPNPIREDSSNSEPASPPDAFPEIKANDIRQPVTTAPMFEASPADLKGTSHLSSPSRMETTNDRFGGYLPVDVTRRGTNEIGRSATPIFENDPTFSATNTTLAPSVNEDFEPHYKTHSTIIGETYNIEPNDNYWTVSRKKYGTGRYFMALSQHNLHVIPDPKRMKPGVTIETPSAEHLEKDYPTLIPRAAPDNSSHLSEPSSPIKTTIVGESRFFVSPEGIPMYRIGKEDTLSDIAHSHLGRSSRWVQVYEMNRDVLADGNKLTVGTVLRLPGDANRVDVVESSRVDR